MKPGRTRTGRSNQERKPEGAPTQAVRIPHDPVNEMVLIAAVIVDESARKRYLQTTPADYMLGSGHALIWATLQEMDRKGLHYDPLTLKQLGGEIDVTFVEGLIEQRPVAPPNLKHHVEMLRWDAARVSTARGAVTTFLELLKDPKSEPLALRSAARHIEAGLAVGTNHSLRNPTQLVEEQMKVIDERRKGVATYGFGIPGLDFYGDGDFSMIDGERVDLDDTPRLIPGTAPGFITVVTGTSGCLAGDTLIGVNRAGKGSAMRLDHVVKMFNGGRAGTRTWDLSIPTMVRARLDDGTVGLVELSDAYVSGIKEVFELTVGTNVIRATADHRILAEHGWTRLGKLKVGDSVWVEDSRRPTCRGTERERGERKPYRMRSVRYHPYGHTIQGLSCVVPVHRLVIEAQLNGMPYEEFCTYLHTHRPTRGEFNFVNSKTHVVHHVDRNPLNNDVTNLQLLTHAEHQEVHRVLTTCNLRSRVVLTKVTSITPAGQWPTYDLTMAGPHNFLANGIVVHNSGKTTATTRGALGMYRAGRRIAYGAYEQGSGMSLELMACMSLGMSRTDLMTGNFDDEDAKDLRHEMEMIGQHVVFDEIPFNNFDERKMKHQNQRAMDRIAQSIVDSKCNVYIADLFRRTMGETDPSDEERALYRMQEMAKALKVHIILVQQQNSKLVEATKHKFPTRDTIKGSGAWVEIADQIIGWYRPALYKNVPDDRISAIIMKQRYGKWPQMVEFEWEPTYGRIENGKTVDMKFASEEDDGFQPVSAASVNKQFSGRDGRK